MLPLLDFNSIKVRLERKYDKNRKENLQFQFHKGTIRTIIDSVYEKAIVKFQFHKGTIKTYKNKITSLSLTISIP